jgi:serine/threonine protein kinase
MLAFAHLAFPRADDPADMSDPIKEVQRQARRILGEKMADYLNLTFETQRLVPREGELTFVPQVPGVDFSPPTRSFTWKESVHREEFRLCASNDMDGKTARGSMTVFLRTIILAEIPLYMRVDSREEFESQRDSHEFARARPYRKIFASYSRKDSWVVEPLRRYAKLLGDEYVKKHARLRAGEEWSEKVQRLIEEADIFQLFWSTNSMHSQFVRKEWECALSLGRANFIRPVYWEEPLPTSPEKELPPQALRRLHFQRIPPVEGEGAPAARQTPPRDMPNSTEGSGGLLPARRQKSPGPSLGRKSESKQDVHVESRGATRASSAEGGTLAPGDEVVPGYRVVQLLGRGGHGEVWRALGPGGISTALKIFSDLQVGDRELKALETIQSVHHRNLLDLHGYWLIDAEGQIIPNEVRGKSNAPVTKRLVLASQLADMSLQDRLQECRQQPNLLGIPADELLSYMMQAAEAIDFLNTHGIRHADIKPENILIVAGIAKVSDFGLKGLNLQTYPASAAEAFPLAHAAPELFLGIPSDKSDQYSLAITYYELRTGRLPFKDQSTFYEIVSSAAEGNLDLSALPPEEQRVIRRATSQNPKNRFSTAKEMITQLTRASAPLEAEATMPPSPIEEAPMEEGKPHLKLGHLVVMATLIGALIAGSLTLLYFWRDISDFVK